jgi:hypothetical protein
MTFSDFGDLACPGDVDRDGIPDLLVSEYGYPQGGRVGLYSGRTGSLLQECVDPPRSGPESDTCEPLSNYGEDVSELFGYSLAAAGDVDADGVPDWIVSECSPAGDMVSRMVVYSGADARPLFVRYRDRLLIPTTLR